MARPTVLTEEVSNKICDAIRAGNTRRASAEYAGVSERTLYSWIETASAEDAPSEFLQFLQSLKKAEADCEVANVATIKKAATGYDVRKVVTKTKQFKQPVKSRSGVTEYVDVTETETTETTTREFAWQAAAWWLERRRPDDYKPRTATELSGDPNKPVAVKVLSGVSMNDLE